MELKNKVSLVTGGSRGIGRDIALSLAKEGSDVVFFYRANQKAANKTEKDILSQGVRCKAYQVDITDYEQVETAFEKIEKDFEQLDILINNAGRSPAIRFLVDVPLKEWHGVLDLDLTGVFYCCKAAIPLLRKEKEGHVVNISSVVGSSCKEASVSYAAAKAGVDALTKVLAKEEGKNGIRVNCIAPGFIEVGMSLKMIEAMGEEAFNKMLASIPLSKIKGLPKDISDAVVFLVTSKSRYITGQVIHINGGSWMA